MKIGDRRFYPPHGVVTLTAVEEREFGGSRDEFHVLEIARGGTVLVPSKLVGNESMRSLVSATKAKELLKRVASKAKLKIDPDLDTKGRASLYDDQLKVGDPIKYTEILRDLMIRGATQKLSAAEQDLLARSRAYFIGEIATVLKLDPHKIDADLDAVVAKHISTPPADDEDE